MRPKLSFANVVSVFALFVALGGTAIAASQLGKNSVGPKQLKKNAVTTAKIKNEAVTALKVKKGTLTGAQINASTLGTVPAATGAQNAARASVADSLAASEPWHVVGAPGEPQLAGPCETYEGRSVKFFKDHEGVVHLEGEYSCLIVATFAFQLPPGYRPDQTQNFPQPLEGRLTIFGPDKAAFGQVYCVPSNVCSLGGITFRAES